MSEPSKEGANTIRLAERRVFSQSFKPLYNEGMGLVEQAAEYLDGEGRAEAKKLSRLAATLYAAESMRLTTRLMQIASWLLLQRAANSGEMTRDQVASEKSKVRLDTASAHAEATGWDELPKAFVDLVNRSLSLQALVRRMDDEIYGKNTVVSINAPAPFQSGFRSDQPSEHGFRPRLNFSAACGQRFGRCGFALSRYPLQTRRLQHCLLPLCSHLSGIDPAERYSSAMVQAIRIIGIDPGLRRTGWGVVETLGNSLRFIAAGTVKSDDKAALAVRLCQLHDGLRDVLHLQAPDEAAVEQTFVNKDAVATLKLGQARGIAMLVPALAGLAVAEYAPNAVKKAVIGVGHGDKRQIHMMVKVLMPKAVFDSEHAADALAIAICHAHHRQSAAGRLAAALAG